MGGQQHRQSIWKSTSWSWDWEIEAPSDGMTLDGAAGAAPAAGVAAAAGVAGVSEEVAAAGAGVAGGAADEAGVVELSSGVDEGAFAELPDEGLLPTRRFMSCSWVTLAPAPKPPRPPPGASGSPSMRALTASKFSSSWVT